MSTDILDKLIALIPLDVQKLGLVLVLSFLIGLDREEHKNEATTAYSFGGVRTFPLLGIIGYLVALIVNGQPLPVSIGFGVIAIFMLLSFQNKFTGGRAAGLTSEAAGLLTYLLGPLIFQEHYWLATTTVVVCLLLLELKTGLENLVKRIPIYQVLTFTKFLLLSVVILPILPREEFTVYHLNLFKTWLIVVAISGLSYASYLLQILLGSRSGVMLSAILGGAYSSTVATIVLSKASKNQGRPHLFSGGILAASGVMYLRLVALLGIFNVALRNKLSLPLLLLSGLAIGGGLLWSKLQDQPSQNATEELNVKNPLELSSAFLFAFLFLTMLIVTGVVLENFGNIGIYVLALITGVTDVDPFIMGLTQSAGQATPLQIAATGILIAASSNNIIKGIYSYSFSRNAAGKQAFLLLVALAVLGLTPLFLIW